MARCALQPCGKMQAIHWEASMRYPTLSVRAVTAKLAAALLVGCGGASSDAGGLATPADWARLSSVRGLCCNYTPLVMKDGSPHFFSNVLGEQGEQGEGQLYRYAGSWNRVTAGQLALAATDVTDVGPSSYKVRTSGIRHDPRAGWVAILRVGQGYPTSDGYVPALATSADGVRWTYRGKLQIEGRVWPAFSDAANLILQMDKPAVLNSEQPFENRYVILENNINIDGRARKLVAVVSADGLAWRFHRDSSGAVVDLWPADVALAADQPVFPSADSVRGDIHLIAGDRWRESASPVLAHRHLCAARGSSRFKYLGDASTWTSGSKVPNVAYDAVSDTLYAVSGAVSYALPRASTACR
jgi:hypothetical protein